MIFEGGKGRFGGGWRDEGRSYDFKLFTAS